MSLTNRLTSNPATQIVTAEQLAYTGRHRGATPLWRAITGRRPRYRRLYAAPRRTPGEFLLYVLGAR